MLFFIVCNYTYIFRFFRFAGIPPFSGGRVFRSCAGPGPGRVPVLVLVLVLVLVVCSGGHCLGFNQEQPGIPAYQPQP